MSEKKSTSDIVQTSTPSGEISPSPRGPGLEVVEVNGIKWRVWKEGYKLQPGEIVSYNTKLKRKVVTGGKNA